MGLLAQGEVLEKIQRQGRGQEGKGRVGPLSDPRNPAAGPTETKSLPGAPNFHMTKVMAAIAQRCHGNLWQVLT
jgi:hypothetical protein